MSNAAERDVTIAKVTDEGDDRLTVEGTVDGEPVLAAGWVSAMDNHYDTDPDPETGNRPEGAKARPMTDPERHAYWERLLMEAAPAAVAPTVLYKKD